MVDRIGESKYKSPLQSRPDDDDDDVDTYKSGGGPGAAAVI